MLLNWPDAPANTRQVLESLLAELATPHADSYHVARILAPLAACLAIAAVVGLGPLSSRMTEDAAQAASQESCQTEDTVQPQERDVSTEPQTASDDNAANAGAAQYFASTSDSAGSGQTETTQEDTVQAPASLPSTLQTAPEESTPQQEEDTARKETTLIQDCLLYTSDAADD